MATRSRTATRGRNSSSRGKSGSSKSRTSKKPASAGNVTFVFLNGSAKIDYSAVAKEVDALKKLDTVEAIEARLEEIERDKGATFRQAVATGISPHMIKIGLRFTRDWISDQGQQALKTGKEHARKGLNWLGGVFRDLGEAMQSSGSETGGGNSTGGSKPYRH